MKKTLLTIAGLIVIASPVHAAEYETQKESLAAASVGTIDVKSAEEKLIGAFAEAMGWDAGEVSFADLVSFVNDLNKKLVSDGPSRDVAPSDGPSRSVAPSDGPSRSLPPSDGPSVALPPSDGPSFSHEQGYGEYSGPWKVLMKIDTAQNIMPLK